MALLVRADGSRALVKPKGKEFTLEELYQHIGCSTVEAHPHGLMTAWVDEQGIINGGPLNEVASALLGYTVVGDVLFTHPKETS